MKNKFVATLSPFCLCLLAGNASAALEPFTVGASETISHLSNVLHADSADHEADWLSETTINGTVDQTFGRERFQGNAAFNIDRYHREQGRNAEGYNLAGELDWSTIGDLSGALGADSRRHQYLYGFDGDRSSTGKNLETDNHAFARVQLGGMARWSIFAGFDANQRKFSSSDFDINELNQWSTSGGTTYSTSPDLSFGLQGRYVRGKYPHVLLGNDAQQFSFKTVGVNTNWKASGNSAFDANVGYTTHRIDGEPDQHYVNGGLDWRWTPPGHFAVTVGGQRNASDDSGTSASISNTNSSVNARSLNTSAHINLTYELTAKISLGAQTQYLHRKYSNALIPTGLSFGDQIIYTQATGSSNTTSFGVSATYAPTRTTTVMCGVSREVLSADVSIARIANRYTDNTVMCTAAIRFD